MNYTGYKNIVCLTGLIGLFLFYPLFAFSSGEVRGKVVEVTDGNTVLVETLSGKKRCELYGVSAPVPTHGHIPGQKYGDQAKKELEGLVLNQDISLIVIKEAAPGGNLCILFMGKDNLNINLEMVRLGHAWANMAQIDHTFASVFVEASSQARKYKLGIWSGGNPIPPWEYKGFKKDTIKIKSQDSES